ncbi:MAG: DUF1214 domain-containing protein [Myxococcota bacterium]
MSDDAARLLSGEAWRDFCRRLEATGEAILGEAYPDDPRTRAEGYRALTRLLVYSTQLEIEAGDPLFPSFVRHQDPHNQWGGPNPDNVYLRANIDPGESYRVWADDVRGVRQAIFSLHQGDMQLREYGVYGECSLDQLERRPDGGLELWLSPEDGPGNRIRMDPRARIFTIRIYQADWGADAAPPFQIERVGAEGVPRPVLTPEAVARGLDRSMRWVEASAAFWNQYTREAWDRGKPNAAAPAQPMPGGADNILYGACLWELADDEALLLEVEEPDADYWSFVTHTLTWLESGDFDQRQTSLNGQQTHVDPDGRVRLVVAHEDPGVPNWLDTEGRRRGMLIYRWVWARSAPIPAAQLVKRDAVRELLPADHPVVTPEERRCGLAGRRAQAWGRFR